MSGTAAKMAVQFRRTWSRPRKSRDGCTGDSLRYSSVKHSTTRSMSWVFAAADTRWAKVAYRSAVPVMTTSRYLLQCLVSIWSVSRLPGPVKSGPVTTQRRYDASRRRAQARARQEAVLDSARELFLQDGFARTTVAAVATRAGVSQETVYKTFGGK